MFYSLVQVIQPLPRCCGVDIRRRIAYWLVLQERGEAKIVCSLNTVAFTALRPDRCSGVTGPN